MGRGRDATTYGFCSENRDDIVECGRQMAPLVMLSDDYLSQAVYQKNISAQKVHWELAGI
jgi:hypothetical protein